jgi:hypothetical protein
MNRNNIYSNPQNNIYQPDQLYINPPLNVNKPIPQFSEVGINEFKKEHHSPYHNEKSYQYPSHTISGSNQLGRSFNPTNTFNGGYIASNEYEKPKTMHDNLAPVLMNKEVMEYPIIIDSADRDYLLYNNPFNFRVTLNGVSGLRTPFLPRDFENIKFVKLINCAIPRYYRLKKINQTYNEDIVANTTVYIDTTWSVNVGNVYSVSYLNSMLSDFPNSQENINGNVSTYLTLNLQGYITGNINGTIQTTYTNNYQRTYLSNPTSYSSGNLSVTNYQLDYIVNSNVDYVYVYDTSLTSNTSYTLTEDLDFDIFRERYLLLHMSEMKNINENSTNDSISRSFAVLYPNKINRSFIYLFTDGVDKFFKNSDLQNLKNMTFYLEDSEGNKLENPYLNLAMNNISRKSPITIDSASGLLDIDYTAPGKYIRHPYYKNNQMTILMKVGIYENDIDKNLFAYNK